MWATRVASAVQRGFGYLLIVAGIFLIFFAGVLTGAWLAFIGWFLVLAATAEGDAGIPSRTEASKPAP